MIKYVEKGGNLHFVLSDAGYQLKDNTNDEAFDSQGNQSAEIDRAVQAIIDQYNPLPEAQTEASEKVNTAAGEARTRYVTAVPSQDATYQMKLEDARAFKLANYPEANLSSYPFIDGEAKAIASTGQAAADLIIDTYTGWLSLAAYIETTRRVAGEDIKRETVWRNCSVIANAALSKLDAI